MHMITGTLHIPPSEMNNKSNTPNNVTSKQSIINNSSLAVTYMNFHCEKKLQSRNSRDEDKKETEKMKYFRDS